MAVHTKVSKINLLEIIKNYNLGKLQNYHGIKEGIENTNYFVQTSKK
ncbi:MAG: homoserine kinase, partial [Rickettsiales bacterium]|nr:homoserine kinase [Rickettsiales bacterium]